ncbi:cyclic-di-AMP receptor, partial [[Clostridium] innocuum]|nr:cyclic-di-AMP receptor [[Clostridium] innocuum]
YDIGRYASFPVEVQVGGATIFVIDVEKFIKL